MSSTIAGPTVIGGRYSVERQLGYGATATVYLCRDRVTNNLVAVKVLRVELAESVGADRFLREIRLTSELSHPAILPVIDSGADGSILYCVLPYMEGGTLRDVLRETKQLSIADAVRIGRTIADALSYAHEKGLIHRDIKPENILFTEGRAVLGDFGIARLLYATAGDLTTTTGVVRGTPAYMSPEQASGERNLDGRSDIYSLAAVVYEMIAGMPPFVGPTQQSVLAQRFSSTPRPISVYRKTVPAQLEQVIDKAMAIVPADRHATAQEFSEALGAGGHSTGIAAGRRTSRARSWAVGAAVLGAGAVISYLAIQGGVMGAGGGSVRPDTTQLAVLPFERDAGSDSLGSIDAFVYDAFSAWRGLTVIEPFQVRDAVARKHTVSGVERDRAVALALGAGRFVRGSVVAMPGRAGWKVHAWLYQLNGRRDTLLFDHSITITPAELLSIDTRYATLARALLLRGQDTASANTLVTTTSLPAMQRFARGIAAVDEWDFATADTQFQRAIEIDPEYRRAYLWQAQVRFWQRTAPDQWAPLAQMALVDTTRLPVRDRRLALALAALGNKDYDGACREYDALRDRNASDFAAWFGRGRCRDLDFRIVRDGRSPTGWRYVSSYAEAVASYKRAFEVLSLSQRSLERGAFEPLRDLLFMRPSKLQAASPPPDVKEPYVGRLDWEDGKPILRPIRFALLSSGDPAAVPSGLRTAILSQQKLFGAIAAAWSTALPNSAGAKEGVVVALEMRGDRSALDTLRAARRLVTEPDAKLRLASAEAVLRLKFASPNDSVEIAAIKSLADSLLLSNPTPKGRAASYLAPLAAMTGRCRLAGDLASEFPFSNPRATPRDVIGAADALLTRSILGCAVDAEGEVERLKRRLETSSAPPGTVNNLLLRTVQTLDSRDTTLTAPFAATGVYLLVGQRALLRGRPDTVRVIMARLNQSRQRTGYDDIAPDAIYLESKLLLAVGDTAGAMTSLDRLLDRLPFLTPGMLNRPVEMGGLMRAMRLRGDLARARNETGRWDMGQKALWSNADPSVHIRSSAPPRR